MGQNSSHLPVLDSVEHVVLQSQCVHFHPQHLDQAVREWGHLIWDGGSWEHPCHYFDGTEDSVRWIFVLDVLNHCFWPEKDEEPWTVTYRGEDYSGYWGLAASLKAALEKGIPLTDSSYLANISLSELREVFSGKGLIPLLEARLFNLREAGRILCSQWDGDIIHLLEKGRGSAVQTVLKVVSSFPSFRDEAQYRGRNIIFWKRAQLFVSDLNVAFSGKDWGNFHDLHVLSAFADYKLPQVLRHLRVISYCPELEGRVDRRENIEPSSEEEIEIRAMTIWAVEEFKAVFRNAGKAVNSSQIDGWLWRLGQLQPFRGKPYHRCRTIFY